MSIESWPPAGALLLAGFRVDGEPKPAGSKNAIPLMRFDKATGRRVPIVRGDGTPIINQVDSSGEPGQAWRTDIRDACAKVLDVAHELADGPLAVRVTFYVPRPKGHYGTGRNAGILKANADRFPHQSRLADGTKLARALEDALNAVLWTDDRRVCDLWWSRRFGRSGADVEVFTLPASFEQVQIEPEPETLSLLAVAGSDGYH